MIRSSRVQIGARFGAEDVNEIECTGRLLTALAGLGTIGTMGLAMAAAPDYVIVGRSVTSLRARGALLT